MTTLDLARKASDHFGQAGQDPAFEMPEAIIFGVDGEEIFVLTCGKDIYQAIELAHRSPAVAVDYKSDYLAVGAFTSGWAAPIPKDGSELTVPPKEHPDARRVTLLTVFTKTEAASIVQFADGEQFTDEDGEAHGALADAMFNLAHRVLA